MPVAGLADLFNSETGFSSDMFQRRVIPSTLQAEKQHAPVSACVVTESKVSDHSHICYRIITHQNIHVHR